MRTEKDFLGEANVADEVYYGVQTLRAVQNFPITGEKINRDLILALAVIKRSAALANMSTGRLEEPLGEAIVAATDEILSGKLHDQFVVDPIQGGAGTSINMNANEVIANRALELLGANKGEYSILSPNNHVNMAQSTNDVIPTAIRITSIWKVKQLITSLSLLRKRFQEKAVAFESVLKMGRTHLQDAVPITLGQEFLAYAQVVGRAIHRIQAAETRLHTVNLGATAVGTGLNAEPAYIERVVAEVSAVTGERFYSADNLVDATQNTDELADLSGALKVTALAMSKIANDLRLMASGPRCGLNELHLPARQPGSSIMPGKVNPVIPEVLNQTCFQVIGNDHVISLAVEAGQFELNVMEPVLAYNLFQSITILGNAVRVFSEHCVKDIAANLPRCAELVNGSVGIVTALLPHLGYEKASFVAKEALSTGKSVKMIVLDHKLLKEAELNAILAPAEMTRPGIAGEQFIRRFMQAI